MASAAETHVFARVYCICQPEDRKSVEVLAGRLGGGGVPRKLFPASSERLIPETVRFSEIFWPECACAFMSASVRVRVVCVLLSNWNMNPFTFSRSC